ncbi:MAG TPA: YceI family protein, partial [Bacteroidia bacterium]|nr:YceI family protein [Bacteroidia bacterium]
IMKTLKAITLSIIFLFCMQTRAQNLYPSRVKINTELKDSMWYASSNAGIVQANEGSNEIAFRLDISTIVTDDPNLNPKLANIEKQYLFFKASYPTSNLSFTDTDNESQHDYIGKGFITLNGITKEVGFDCEVYSFNSDDQFSVGNNVYPLRIALFFELLPQDFGLDKIYKPLTKVIEIEVSNGLINKTNLGGNTIFPK